MLLLAVLVATIGRPLVGLGSLHAADTMQLLDPWAQDAPIGLRPDNGTVSDTVDAVAPVRLAIAERARQGDVAMWSVAQGGGAPLLGQPNAAMLSPLNLPWWVTPGHWAPALAKAVQMVVAAGFAFLFGRRVGLSRPAAAVAGLALVNAGHLVVWTTWPQSNVAALVPALFWAADRAVGSPRWADAWPVPLVGAVMWLEGFPALTLWAHVLAGSYVVVRLWGGRRRDDGADGAEVVRRTMLAACAMALGVGVAAVQLVPFALRTAELDTSTRAAKAAAALPWSSMATLVAPDALGSAGAGVWYGPRNEVEMQAFVGVVAVVLGVVALAGNRRLEAATRAWLAFAAGASLVVAALVWVDGPFQDAVQSLPLIGGNQTGRLRGLLAFLLAGAAGVGFEVLLRVAGDRWPSGAERDRAPRDGWRVLGLVLVGTAAVVVALAPAADRALDLAAEAGRTAFAVEALARPAALAVVTLVLVAVALVSRATPRRVAVAVLPLLLALEVTSFARGFLPRIDADQFYPRTAAHDVVADLVGPDRLAAGGLALYPGTTTAYGLRSVTAHAGMPAAWKRLLLDADPTAFDANATFPMLGPTLGVATSEALDLVGASHFVTEMDVPVLGRRDPATLAGSTLPPGAGIHGVDVHRDVLAVFEDHDPPMDLVAWVQDADGKRVALGARRLRPDEGGEWLSVPLAPAVVGAPAPQRGRLVVAVELAGAGPGITVAVPTGLLVRPVRVGPEGLRVVAAPGVVAYERPSALPRVRLEDPFDRALTTPVELLEDGDDVLRVRVAVPAGGGTLVVADALSGGHRARVDGEPVTPVAAHDALVGVPLGPGEHEVVLTWQPEGVRAGAAVTVASLLLVALALWLSSRDGDHRRVGSAQAVGVEVLDQRPGAVREGVPGQDRGPAPT